MQVELEDASKERFRVWCNTEHRYVLRNADAKQTRRFLFDTIKRNGKRVVRDLLTFAREDGVVPPRDEPICH